MKTKTRKKVKYSDEPLELRAVKDFLPPPEKLALKDKTVKVTISLSQSSVEFFKKQARDRQVPYQAMIRKVLDLYSKNYG
ncbi:MAG: BrnA antitoxin family protein [Nitrospinae bacterium]|nr:BrnA antitoxin family protein [Nitrospinota bacterium]